MCSKNNSMNFTRTDNSLKHHRLPAYYFHKNNNIK